MGTVLPDVTPEGDELVVVLHTMRYYSPERLEGSADNLDQAMHMMEGFVDQNTCAPVAIQVGNDFWRQARKGEEGVKASGDDSWIEWVRCDRSEVADELEPDPLPAGEA